MRTENSYDIWDNTIKVELSLNNTQSLEGVTKYPSVNIEGSKNTVVTEEANNTNSVNSFYQKKALDQQKYIISQLLKPSMEENINLDRPDAGCQWDSNYAITYNKKPFLSMYNDQYQYTGGAHGIAMRTAQTWNVEGGKQLSLKDFFPHIENYVEKLKAEISRQIKNNLANEPGIYFGNYDELVNQNFNEGNFYIKQEPLSLIIFFEPYEIAPYSTGIPEFEIGFKDSSN